MSVVRKIVSFFLVSAVFAAAFFITQGDLTKAEAAEQSVSRVINVVYDDSGSMAKDFDGTKQPLDRWCQAKYAMEVFASMLGDNDTMNVYVMSDFDRSGYTNADASVRLKLVGSDGQSANVKKIHDMVTELGNTPFTSVRKAYSDLCSTTADEKWLVVLTDGDFENIAKSEVKNFFASKDGSVSVMFLSMGKSSSGSNLNDDTGSIVPDEANNIFYEEAISSSDILSKITGISTRIFNSNQLPDANVQSGTASFDVPMGELTIFAQGQNVSINGIKDADGNTYGTDTAAVDVRYSETADAAGRSTYADAIINTDLVGQVKTISGDFDAGTYTLDVTGADTIEVFYKPNVEIRAYLYDDNGDQVDTTDIRTGDYTIRFGFVKAGTEEKVETSGLLGDIAYDAEITNNGNVISGVTDGSVISIEESTEGTDGTLHIDVTATFLTYNTVSTSLDLGVYSDKDLTFTETSSPVSTIVGMAAEMASEPILVQMTVNGKTPSEEQWAQTNLEDFTVMMGEDGEAFSCDLMKTDVPGELRLVPKMNALTVSPKSYTGDYAYIISYSGKQGSAVWEGSGSGTLHVDDQRTTWERWSWLIIRLLIAAAILLLILGYVPGIKKYLPKNLKIHPRINCTPNRVGVKAVPSKGQLNKNLASTLIPYKAQTGFIRFAPKGSGVPQLAVKAAGGRRMYVTNAKSFVKKKNITFDGIPVEEEVARKMRISSGCTISVNMQTKGVTYSCIPSQK